MEGVTCSGAATLCAQQILSAYEFTVSVFYVLQIMTLTFILTEDEVQSILECHPLVYIHWTRTVILTLT